MPKLRRMRLVSIGHDDARFEDVTLRFTDRAGKPTNSVIWLRNGGGKTSLLSLFFAGVRPHLRDFLGKRAESKIKSIEDYVGPRDHSVVACEWELDAERGLFDEGGPRYLTGVFYQRASSHEQNGDGGVERAFFACLASPTVAELSLDGLPLITEGAHSKSRRNLNGFRRRWRQLNGDYPAQEVFLSEKQNAFEEELASRGIDPEVFFNQIQMNEREGGVLEKFSFSHDEELLTNFPRPSRAIRHFQQKVKRRRAVDRCHSFVLRPGALAECRKAEPVRSEGGEDTPEDLTGKSVCFTGTLRCKLKGEPISREIAQQLAADAGMTIAENVTKALDILVVADPHSMSGTAKKARQYGTRIMAEMAFWRALGIAVD